MKLIDLQDYYNEHKKEMTKLEKLAFFNVITSNIKLLKSLNNGRKTKTED